MAYTELKTRRRTHYPYVLDYRTRWWGPAVAQLDKHRVDNDMYAHMNNSIYNHLIDSAVNAYLMQHCGLDPSNTAPTNPDQADQIGLVVASHCSYFAPVGFPAVLDVGLRIRKLGKSSVEYEIAVFERGADDPKAVGGFTHVFVDRASRKVDPKNGMGEALRRGLAELQTRQAKL